MWANYLEAFDEVRILARVANEDRECEEKARADGPGVSFLALPDYQGPWQYARHLPELRRHARQAVEECDAHILRVPGLVSGLVWRELRKRKKPYALQVVGDPWDALGPGTLAGIFRPAFRQMAARELKTMCLEATAVHYVTQSALQRRYPAGKNAYAVGFSDALMDSAFASAAQMEERFRRIAEIESGPANGNRGALRIGFAGSFSQMYKGPDVLLRAVAACVGRGVNVGAALAGEGRCAGAMKALASELGIAERVEFLGQLPVGRVFAFLDSVDLFVMPSYAEGLPRALLEAMARGCPCIGSDVGGIPELLRAEDIVPPGNSKALAQRILEVTGNPQRLRKMSLGNLEKAREFNPEALRETRQAFYRFVRLHSGANRAR